MQKKIILLILSIFILLSWVSSVNAVTISSSLVTVSTYSIISSFIGGGVVNGDACIGQCTTSGKYAKTIFIDGISQGTNRINTCNNVFIGRNCGVIISKARVYNCTYKSSVATRGACSMSGIQYATSYYYNTVPGNTCRDITTTYRYCTPPDAIAPTASATNSSTTVWKKANIPITLYAADSGGSGLSTAKYRWDNSNCSAGTAYTNGSSITLPTAGTHVLYLCVKDGTGNTGTWNGTYKLDKTLPTTSATNASTIWKNAYIPITLYAADSGGSGLSTAKYRWDNSNCSVGTPYANGSSITLYNEGTHVLYLCVTDSAGNTGTWNGTYKLDKTLPTASATNSSTTAWKNANISITLYATDSGGSGLSTAKYRWDNSTCSAGTAYANGSSITLSTEGTHILYLCVTDGAGNTGTWNGTYKLDKTKPVLNDISGLGVDLDGAYFIATDSKNLSINVSNGGFSPIVSIRGEFEGVSATDLETLTPSNNDTLPVVRDVSLIDHGVVPSDIIIGKNYRDFTFKITEIKDEAGNSMISTQLPTYTYHVYAGKVETPNSTVSGILDFTGGDEIADGTEKTLTVELKDVFDNKVVPVYKSILDGGTSVRKVKLTAKYDNDLYLDQLSNSGVGVELTGFDDGLYTDSFTGTTQTKSTTITDETNNDGIYDIKFKVYSPTYSSSATDGRKLAKGNFTINSINSFTDDNNYTSPNLLSPIDFQFRPIYYTTLGGKLFDDGFIEGFSQTGSISIERNDFVTDTTNSKLIFTKTFSGSTLADFTATGSIDSGEKKLINNVGTPLISEINNLNLGQYILKTLITLVDGDGNVDDIKYLRLNEYVQYALGTKTVTYLAGILNDINTQNFEMLKIYGITNIDKAKQKDLLTNQGAEDIHNLDGEIVKSGLKRDIRKTAINTIKVISTTVTDNDITELADDDWSGNLEGEKLGNILYFGGLEGGNVTLNSSDELVGRKTIVIKGGNLYIKSNITNSSNDDILGIIVLKDDQGRGGKIYIDTSVLEVDAIIYADKSVMSYNESYDNGDSDDTILHEVDGNIDSQVMQNQLYIYGTVFSENTIGGSRLNPPVCPFYTQSDTSIICDTIEAQKYDFNYLRAGFEHKNNSGYADYPVIIKYNSRMQVTPPPLFTN